MQRDIYGVLALSLALQCVALRCRALPCIAVRCSVLPCVAVCCSVLQCVAVCCSVLQCVAVCCIVSVDNSTQFFSANNLREKIIIKIALHLSMKCAKTPSTIVEPLLCNLFFDNRI